MDGRTEMMRLMTHDVFTYTHTSWPGVHDLVEPRCIFQLRVVSFFFCFRRARRRMVRDGEDRQQATSTGRAQKVWRIYNS